MDQPSDFSPESMSAWAKDLATDSAARLSQEERLIAIRSVVGAFLEYNVIDNSDFDSADGAFNAAAQSLYMCHLIPMIFAKAYADVGVQLDDDQKAELARQEAIESLKRSFRL
jgi:hypothetical protein